MAPSLRSVREQRHDQIYATLDPLEIDRVRRFGDLRSFSAGEALMAGGQIAPGLMVILSGKIAVTEHGYFDNPTPILVHESGNFLGELAQLAGCPALVDAVAQEPVEALVIPPERLRALMIAEALSPESRARSQVADDRHAPPL
jgi:thioredoxin reductase (NADPH)